MLELFGFAWVTITFTCCVAAVSTRRSMLRWLKARTDRKRLDDTVEIVRRPMRKVATYAALVVLAVPAGVLAGGGALPGPSGGGGGLPTAGGTMTGQVVFDGASSDILCDITSGASEPLTFCPATGQEVAITATAVASTGENMFSWGVSDVTGRCGQFNATTGDARFAPAISCYNNQNAADSFYWQYVVNATYDSGTSPAHIFRATRGTTVTTGTAALTTRPTFAFQNYITTQLDITAGGVTRPLLYGSQSNCSDGAGAAACSAAPAGSVVIDAGATTVVVSTTAVTANSQIFVQEDSSLGTKLGVTCNTTYTRDYYVTARTAATSFTITTSASPVTNPACLSYFIVN